jgi:O-antigen ligase
LESIPPYQILNMHCALQNPTTVREHLASRLVTVARLTFGLLLFSSPLGLRQTLVARPVANIFSGYTDFDFFASDLFLLLTLGLWSLSLAVCRRRVRSGPWFLSLPISGLVLLSWVGVVSGIDHALTLYQSVRFTLLWGLYLFLVNEEIGPIWVAVPLALGGILEALVAVGQFSLQHSIGLASWGELSLNPLDSGTSVLLLDGVRILRAYGLTEHPNILGGFLAFGLVLILGFFLVVPSGRRSRYLLLLPLAVGGLGLFLSFSRAAALAFVAGAALLALFALWNPTTRARRVFDLGLVATVMLCASALPIVANLGLVGQRIGQNNSFQDNHTEQRSLAERDALIASANRVFYKHEVLGVGNGALTLAMYELDDQFPKEYYYQPAHFVLLDAATELGLLGGMFWLWLLVAPAIALWLLRREVMLNPWIGATAAALLVITIVGFYDYYPWLSVSGRVWQWGAWGLFAAAIEVKGKV